MAAKIRQVVCGQVLSKFGANVGAPLCRGWGPLRDASEVVLANSWCSRRTDLVPAAPDVESYKPITSASFLTSKLDVPAAVWVWIMRNLVGRCFNLADGRYRVVDIRQLGGDAMVYAELLAAEPGLMDSDATGPLATGGRPGRMAFHYTDIAAALRAQESA